MEKPKISKRKIRVLLGKVSKHERHQGSKETARRLKQLGKNIGICIDKDKFPVQD